MISGQPFGSIDRKYYYLGIRWTEEAFWSTSWSRPGTDGTMCCIWLFVPREPSCMGQKRKQEGEKEGGIFASWTALEEF